jgi:hypothetical protein
LTDGSLLIVFVLYARLSVLLHGLNCDVVLCMHMVLWWLDRARDWTCGPALRKSILFFESSGALY